MFLFLFKDVLLIAQFTNHFNSVNQSSVWIDHRLKRLYSAESTTIFDFGSFPRTIFAHENIAFLVIAEDTIGGMFVTQFTN